jgi:hypothetical protein
MGKCRTAADNRWRHLVSVRFPKVTPDSMSLIKIALGREVQ